VDGVVLTQPAVTRSSPDDALCDLPGYALRRATNVVMADLAERLSDRPQGSRTRRFCSWPPSAPTCSRVFPPSPLSFPSGAEGSVGLMVVQRRTNRSRGSRAARRFSIPPFQTTSWHIMSVRGRQHWLFTGLQWPDRKNAAGLYPALFCGSRHVAAVTQGQPGVTISLYAKTVQTKTAKAEKRKG